MTVTRMSILSRPIRSHNPRGDESSEKQYEAELSRLQAKRERYNNTQNFVRQMINPSHLEKIQLQNDMNDARSLQLEEKRLQRRKTDVTVHSESEGVGEKFEAPEAHCHRRTGL